jgi:transposase-like protein
MSGKRFKTEEVVRHLREADVMLSQGVNVADVIRKLGVNKITYYRWRREFGGMKVDQARRMKDLERENMRLKKLVADLSLDNSILKEAASGNF